jgi:DNA helicase-2/ATP-dependent DNA helicase PcrA
LHAAKGLEFRVVFIIGLDDGMIPHQRSFEDPEAMSEERRLFYVGITRAKDRLYLVRAFRRRLYGASAMSEPSRYLSDLPADILSGDWLGGQTQEQASYARQTSWDSPSPLPQARYTAGMRVVHPTFGEGIVMESRVDRDDEEVVVAFESGEVKHLVASLARLETPSD